MAKVKNKDTESVVTALIKQSKKLPDELYKSLTWDRGKELSDHQRFTLETDVDVYFCDPRSPWQRGSNQNTNRLLRQYLPKGTDLSLHSQARLNAIARQLNVLRITSTLISFLSLYRALLSILFAINHRSPPPILRTSVSPLANIDLKQPCADHLTIRLFQRR